jgi:hypothetical protein
MSNERRYEVISISRKDIIEALKENHIPITNVNDFDIGDIVFKLQLELDMFLDSAFNRAINEYLKERVVMSEERYSDKVSKRTKKYV